MGTRAQPRLPMVFVGRHTFSLKVLLILNLSGVSYRWSEHGSLRALPFKASKPSNATTRNDDS